MNEPQPSPRFGDPSTRFDGANDCLASSVDIPAYGNRPSFTIDWRQDQQGRITDIRFTKGVARYKTPWWRKLLKWLLPGRGWTYVRFQRKTRPVE